MALSQESQASLITDIFMDNNFTPLFNLQSRPLCQTQHTNDNAVSLEGAVLQRHCTFIKSIPVYGIAIGS